MPPRKRASASNGATAEPIAKRRSTRLAATSSSSSSASKVANVDESVGAVKKTPKAKPAPKPKPKLKASPTASKPAKDEGARAVSPDPDPESIPTQNPDAVRHDGEWYWLLKAEPESRFENGIDVRFSIDDLRACTKPEGWDGISSHSLQKTPY